MEHLIILFSNTYELDDLGSCYRSIFDNLMETDPESIQFNNLVDRIIDTSYVDLKTEQVLRKTDYKPEDNIFLINDKAVIAIHHRHKTSLETLYIRILVAISLMSEYHYEQEIIGIYTHNKLYLSTLDTKYIKMSRIREKFKTFCEKRLMRF